MGTSKDTVSKMLIISGVAFIIFAALDGITEYMPIVGLVWVYVAMSYISFLVFIIALYQAGTAFTAIKSNFSRAATFLLIMIFVDLIGFLGIFFGFAGIGLLFGVVFGYALLRGIAFTLVNSALSKLNPSQGNPVYLIYGWADLILTIIYFITPIGPDDYVLMAGTWIDIVLILIIGILLVTRSGRITEASAVAPVTPRTYPTQPVYQPTYQPLQPTTQEPEVEKPTKSFCTNCGAAVVPGDRFCENCGQTL
jgi:hypothetical protein